MRFLLLGNGTISNRGCEAIRLGTVAVLRRAFDHPEIEVIDFGPRRRPNTHDGISVRSVPVERFSAMWFGRHVGRRLGSWRCMPDLRCAVDAADCVLSLGGDNFTADYGSLGMHLDIVDYVATRGKPLVLWGASVGPFGGVGTAFEQSVRDRLRSVRAFLVREDLSLDYLRGLGFSNVWRVADPAFLLESRVPPPDRLGFAVPAGAVGLNLSPLMARFCCAGDLDGWTHEAGDVVQSIAKLTGRPVVLVCHVLTDRSNDYAFLSRVAQRLRLAVPVLVAPPTLSAAEYKGLIGQCACFVGARTHTTIAAFGMGVPTVCLAYSTKGRGISRAVMDSDEWVLMQGEITADSVSLKVQEMLSREDQLREHLRQKAPQLRVDALGAGSLLRALLSPDVPARVVSHK